MDAVLINEFSIFITEITKEGLFTIGEVYEWQRPGISLIALRYTTRVTVCLLTDFVRGNICFLTFRFKNTHCHTVYEQEVVGFPVPFKKTFPNGCSRKSGGIEIPVHYFPTSIFKHLVYFYSCFLFRGHMINQCYKVSDY